MIRFEKILKKSQKNFEKLNQLISELVHNNKKENLKEIFRILVDCQIVDNEDFRSLMRKYG